MQKCPRRVDHGRGIRKDVRRGAKLALFPFLDLYFWLAAINQEGVVFRALLWSPPPRLWASSPFVYMCSWGDDEHDTGVPSCLPLAGGCLFFTASSDPGARWAAPLLMMIA